MTDPDTDPPDDDKDETASDYRDRMLRVRGSRLFQRRPMFCDCRDCQMKRFGEFADLLCEMAGVS